MRDADLAELMRDSVDELTAGTRAPAELASVVLRRHRRRTALRAGGIAVAAAVAAVTAALTAAPGAAPGPAILTADYVIHHTERALAASTSRDFIEACIATTFRPGTAQQVSMRPAAGVRQSWPYQTMPGNWTSSP